MWCWWCCHPFDGPPRFVPTSYDELRDRYRVTGNFCNWGCVKAFMLYDRVYLNRSVIGSLNSLIYRIHGAHYNVPTAPPRTALKVFGGTMNIEEFRNIDKNEYFDINTSIMTIDESYHISKHKR